MSKYISVYEKLCPDDPIEKGDPRRPSIMGEMRAIHVAKSDEEAIEAVKWWDVWPNPQHQNVLAFVKDARKLLNAR